MKQIILITGENGFIGKSLSVLNDRYAIIYAGKDLADEKNISKIFEDKSFKIDHVIHCAVKGGRRNDIDNPNIFYQNTQMFENLIKYKDKYKTLITFGSGAEFKEEFPLNYYGLSKKYISEKIKHDNLNNVVNLRLWGCFGIEESPTGFIKSNLLRYKGRQPMIIYQDRKMDFFYINDIIPIVENIFKNGVLYNEKNLTYRLHWKLSDICKFINTLDTHKVEIKIENQGTDGDYINTLDRQLDVHDNLFNGIKEMYDGLS